MQSRHTLEVRRRERTGSRYAKRERDAGYLPAVLYGHGRPPVALSLQAKEAIKLFEAGEHVFTVEVAGEGITQTVFLKDIQFDYLGTNIVHVDLTRVDMDEVIEAHVPVHYIGEAPGSKAHGAVVMNPTTSLTVECKVSDIPDQIDVDISEIKVGDSLHAGEVGLPEGITLVSDPEDVLYAIQLKAEEPEEPEGEAEVVEAEEAEPEVISERKGEEEEEGTGEEDRG